ncbi:hypothetical protein XENOCAPTIV_017910, partial [Xenoophorus captivus]
LFSSCDLTANKSAHISFKSKQSLTQMAPRAKVSSQFSASPMARNWATATEDLSSVFVMEKAQEAPVFSPNHQLPSAANPSAQTSSDSERSFLITVSVEFRFWSLLFFHTVSGGLGETFVIKTNRLSPDLCVCLLVTAGVAVYPQQEHIQSILPAWVYNDSLVPGTMCSCRGPKPRMMNSRTSRRLRKPEQETRIVQSGQMHFNSLLREGFADFKSVSADDNFTDFKTADSVSPLDPSDQAKIFQPAFPSAFPNSQTLQQLPQQQQLAVSLSQPKNPLNMADLDLFSSVAPSVPASTEKKLSTFPPVSVPPSLSLLTSGAKPSGGGADDFGDFALFGASSDSTQTSIAAGGAPAAPHDDFADFMAFGSSGGEPKGESGTVIRGDSSAKQPQQTSDKYDVFKQLSLEGGLSYDDTKESGGGSFSSLKSDTDDFADFQSSKFSTALGASEKTLVDKVAAFKHGKEDSASVKSLDLPSIGGSSVGKDDSEDALSVQLDMKLSDMGGDLKHVMSDSSLDLPGLSAHQPPATGEELVRLLW